MTVKADLRVVQVFHPLLRRWVKIDARTGRIVKTKRSPGPWRNVAERKAG